MSLVVRDDAVQRHDAVRQLKANKELADIFRGWSITGSRVRDRHPDGRRPRPTLIAEDRGLRSVTLPDRLEPDPVPGTGARPRVLASLPMAHGWALY